MLGFTRRKEMHLKENIKKKETVVIGNVYREMWR